MRRRITLRNSGQPGATVTNLTDTDPQTSSNPAFITGCHSAKSLMELIGGMNGIMEAAVNGAILGARPLRDLRRGAGCRAPIRAVSPNGSIGCWCRIDCRKLIPLSKKGPSRRDRGQSQQSLRRKCAEHSSAPGHLNPRSRSGIVVLKDSAPRYSPHRDGHPHKNKRAAGCLDRCPIGLNAPMPDLNRRRDPSRADRESGCAVGRADRITCGGNRPGRHSPAFLARRCE